MLALLSFAEAGHCICRLLPSISRPLLMFWASHSTRWCAMLSALEEALEARSLAVCFITPQLLWLPTHYAALCDSSWTETRTCTTLATGTPFWAPTRSAHSISSLHSGLMFVQFLTVQWSADALQVFMQYSQSVHVVISSVQYLLLPIENDM